MPEKGKKMLVKCSVIDCGCNYGQFCTSPLVSINNRGFCKRLTKEGWGNHPENSEKMNIAEVEFTDKEKKNET